MRTETLTLTDFLLARITEDEASARLGEWLGFALDSQQNARVLAECEAKRRIVEPWANGDGRAIISLWADEPDLTPPVYITNALAVLKILAAVYADHPDYRDDWRVG